MGSNNFTYSLPSNFKQSLIHFLNINEQKELASLFKNCNITYSDVGYAYYAGIRNGDVWDKCALDFTIECSASINAKLKSQQHNAKIWLEKFIKPNTTGYLIRNIEFIICDDEVEISLPEKSGEDFETLTRDISDSLAKNEPELVLDRLHTYSMKYIREICQKHGITVSAPDGQLHPLHSLAGSLVKFYQGHNTFGSEFAEQALKMSISLFDSYNSIRNNQSFAHDNKVLNKDEAAYVVKIVSATLSFIDTIENT